MKTKILLVSCAVAASAATVYLFKTSQTPPVAPKETLGDAVNRATAVMKEGTRCQFPSGWTASYDYSGSTTSRITIQGMAQPVDATQEYSAKLSFELVDTPSKGEWVLLGQFSKLNETLEKSHGSAFGSPFLVKVGAACDVKGFARLDSVSKKVAQAQQVAVHDLFVKIPEASSAETTYENGTGLARAQFARDSNSALITRTIKSYEMAWRVNNTFQVTQSFAQASLDKNWIETFQSHEGISGGLVNAAVSDLTVKREASPSVQVDPSASRNLNEYRWENLLSGVFTGVTASKGVANISGPEQRYVESMQNSKLEDAFSDLLNRVDEKANIEDQWHEMAGYLNGHPEKIVEFAHGLSQPDFPEQAKAVSYLALSKTVHPQARDALAVLRNNTKLPVGDRTRASLALVTRKDVGIELARDLKRDALESTSGGAEEDEFVGRSSLLHLGVLAGAHKENAEVVEFARDTVSGQLASAGEDTHLLSPALGAAGNLGDPNLLSTLVGYSRHPNYRVRVLVPKSLRGYAYAQTEDIFVDWLARETNYDVKEEIFDIIFHQLAQAQRNAGAGIVREAIRHLKMKPMAAARQSIVHLIGPLKDKFPEAKAALLQQVPEEFRNRSGIFDQIAHYLAPQELELALSGMPEFAHQYGPEQQAKAARAVTDLERNVEQPLTLEAP